MTNHQMEQRQCQAPPHLVPKHDQSQGYFPFLLVEDVGVDRIKA